MSGVSGKISEKSKRAMFKPSKCYGFEQQQSSERVNLLTNSRARCSAAARNYSIISSWAQLKGPLKSVNYEFKG